MDSGDLAPNRLDKTLAVVKSVVGAAPYAGALLCELIGSVVPNQRLDRIVKFAQVLDRRIAAVESALSSNPIQDPDFGELLEEGALQAIRATSDERIEYIGALVASGLTDHQLKYAESRHLLRILGELNDIEIIWLQSMVVQTLGRDPFFETHENVLAPIRRPLGQPQEVYDKAALQDSYKEHLERLGLARRDVTIDAVTKLPKFNQQTGQPVYRSYKLTTLGRLLLRVIGLEHKDR